MFEIDITASGLYYDGAINITLIDYDMQTMNLESQSVAKIYPVLSTSKVSGTDFAKINEGTAYFDDLIFINQPGATNVMFLLGSVTLDETKIKAGLNLTTSEYNQYYKTFIKTNFRY